MLSLQECRREDRRVLRRDFHGFTYKRFGFVAELCHRDTFLAGQVDKERHFLEDRVQGRCDHLLVVGGQHCIDQIGVHSRFSF
jgi:hypothetical protein